jgi:hypothetical protein
MGYASQRDYYVPSGVLSEEEKAAIRANDGFVPFVPFDPRQGSLKHGDTVRLKDGIVERIHDRSGLFDIEFGKVVSPVHISSIAAVRRKPAEPLKVGDFARHSSWGPTTRCEIAVIRDGVALFWPMAGHLYPPQPYPVAELERVK